MKLHFNPSTGKLSYDTISKKVQSSVDICHLCGTNIISRLDVTVSDLVDCGCTYVFYLDDNLNGDQGVGVSPSNVANSINGTVFNLRFESSTPNSCTWSQEIEGDFGSYKTFVFNQGQGGPALEPFCIQDRLFSTDSIVKLRVSVLLQSIANTSATVRIEAIKEGCEFHNTSSLLVFLDKKVVGSCAGMDRTYNDTNSNCEAVIIDDVFPSEIIDCPPLGICHSGSAIVEVI